MSGVAAYIVLLLLIALSAFFSATETAFSSINKIRIKRRADEGDKRAKLAFFIVDNFDRALTSTLIGNNVVNIGASAIATVTAINLFGDNGAAVATVAMTILILVFGEILPKSLANEYSESWALTSSRALRFFMFIVYPFSFLFIKLKEAVIKVVANRDGESLNEPSVTEQELKYIVENIEEEGVLEKQESELVRSALAFDERTVQEILTPRVDMVSLDIEDPIDENIKIVFNSRYSRIPVYRQVSDKIIGILHTRQFLNRLLLHSVVKKDSSTGEMYIAKKTSPVSYEAFDIESMLVPAFFVYKTKSLASLLSDFRHNKKHIAIVTDDYGGTLGIVTMEDLLEQLVGDIWDEDEKEDPDFAKIDDNNYEISGDMPIRDMFELLDFNPKDFECEHKTMGGWALQSFSRIPGLGDSFCFEGLRITVTEMDDQRITGMRISYDRRREK